MNIAIAQLNYHIGHLNYNVQKMIDAIRRSKAAGADLVVFAEMALTGYPANDLWLSPDLVRQTRAQLNVLAEHCQDIACIVGAPVANSSGKGKPLYNAALLLSEGGVQGVTHKTLLPDYDVFDEPRYFEAGTDCSVVMFRGHRIALTVCEDLWAVGDPGRYPVDPMAELIRQQPDLMINIAASPFADGHGIARKNVLETQVQRAGIPLFYVNQVGGQAELIFDGRSLVVAADGTLLDALPAFQESIRLYEFREGDIAALPNRSNRIDVPNLQLSEVELVEPQADSRISLIHQALLLGIRDYFQKSNFREAVLGLSGGLDSAVVAALACEALGPDRVVAVLLPSEYSSDHSVKDALDLVKFTGCQHRVIPIQQATAAFETMLADSFANLPADTTEENLQARIRALILMALSNKFGYTLLNTSNKSEAAVGYGTLYGDMAGAFSVIGDLYKTEVYELAAYLNRDREVIPIHTIQKPPSAELRPDQKDSDSLPDYAVLDPILRAYIDENRPYAEIVDRAGDAALVQRIIQLVDRAEFKRYQSPPTLRVSRKAFGPGRVMPLVSQKKSFPN